MLKQDGIYFLAYAGLSHILLKIFTSMTSNKNLAIESSSQKKEDLIYLKELIEAEIIKPVIDRTFTLNQAAEAHEYAETGQKKGNVVITITHA
jgi:NADPH:quinone reductase-like Zn-dependent oxidoreductase